MGCPGHSLLMCLNFQEKAKLFSKMFVLICMSTSKCWFFAPHSCQCTWYSQTYIFAGLVGKWHLMGILCCTSLTTLGYFLMCFFGHLCPLLIMSVYTSPRRISAHSCFCSPPVSSSPSYSVGSYEVWPMGHERTQSTEGLVHDCHAVSPPNPVITEACVEAARREQRAFHIPA